MADTIFYMTQYLKKRGPIPVRVPEVPEGALPNVHPVLTRRPSSTRQDKEAFVTAAKDVITGCQSVTHFIRVIANHCLDAHCAVELSLVVEQILTVTNQLSIISRWTSLLLWAQSARRGLSMYSTCVLSAPSVNAVTPGCKSSDEILVKNTQNLLQTVLRGVRAAETACITVNGTSGKPVGTSLLLLSNPALSFSSASSRV